MCKSTSICLKKARAKTSENENLLLRLEDLNNKRLHQLEDLNSKLSNVSNELDGAGADIERFSRLKKYEKFSVRA